MQCKICGTKLSPAQKKCYRCGSTIGASMRYEEAEECFKRASKFIEDKNYDSAVKELSEALQLDPDNKTYLIERSLAYKIIKKYGPALNDLNNLITRVQELIRANSSAARELLIELSYIFKMRGDVYFDIENYINAIEDFTQSIKIQPSYHASYEMRIKTHIKLIERLIEIKGDDNNKNITGSCEKYYEKIMEDCEFLSKLNTKAVEYHDENDTIYDSYKQYERVIDYLRMALNQDVVDFEYLVKCGATYFNCAKTMKKITDLLEEIDVSKNKSVSRHINNKLAKPNEYFSEASSFYTRALEILPNHSGIYIYRGDCYFESGSFNNALSDYSKSLSINQNKIVNYYKRGKTYFAMKDFERSKTEFEEFKRRSK